MAFIDLSWTEATEEEIYSTIAMDSGGSAGDHYFRIGPTVVRTREGDSRAETAGSSLGASEN